MSVPTQALDADTLRLDAAAVALGVAGIACCLFTLPSETQYRLVRVEGAGLVALLLLSVLAVAGGRTHRRPLIVVAGAGFAAAAVLQLVQFGRGTNWLSGDGSTFSLFLGLGAGLLTLGLVPLTHPRGGTRAT